MAAAAPLIEESFMASSAQPGVPPAITPAIVPTPPTPAEITTGGEGGGQILPIAGLGILPALFFIGGGGGGSPPIPEPATIIALGIGAAAVMFRRKAKK
jgi:hypothetical protein